MLGRVPLGNIDVLQRLHDSAIRRIDFDLVFFEEPHGLAAGIGKSPAAVISIADENRLADLILTTQRFEYRAHFASHSIHNFKV